MEYKWHINIELEFNHEDEKTRRLAEQLNKLATFMMDYWESSWHMNTNVNCHILDEEVNTIN